MPQYTAIFCLKSQFWEIHLTLLKFMWKSNCYKVLYKWIIKKSPLEVHNCGNKDEANIRHINSNTFKISKPWLSKTNYKYPKTKSKSNMKLIESKYSQKFLVYWETKLNQKIKSKPNVTQIPKKSEIKTKYHAHCQILVLSKCSKTKYHSLLKT